MAVVLREIDEDNWLECVGLKVAEDQAGFVASNAFSLVQARYEPHCVPLAIYDDDLMVGFIMYAYDKDDENYWIYRLMVDSSHQRKGYGRAAVEQVVQILSGVQDCRKIVVSFDPGNLVARQLYLSLGFEETGKMIWDEEVVERTL